MRPVLAFQGSPEEAALIRRLDREARDERAYLAASPALAPSTVRSGNPLRPARLTEMVGQDSLKPMLAHLVARANSQRQPLAHMLLVGPAGTGKTTVANVVANELGSDVWQFEAPISLDTLLVLRTTMKDRDVLLIDEIHLQAIQERRGKMTSTQPEVLFSIMEDHTIITERGVLPFPKITVIGATTDEGMLPDPFVMRFPLRPVLEPYSLADLTELAEANGQALGIDIVPQAAAIFAKACRGTPRVLNNYVKNAEALCATGVVSTDEALDVVVKLNKTTLDGLTRDQQAMLTFLYQRCKRTNQFGDTTYQASVNTIATAIGKSRDAKAIALRVEPTLIERGYIQVGHGGRLLTEDGVRRARELLR